MNQFICAAPQYPFLPPVLENALFNGKRWTGRLINPTQYAISVLDGVFSAEEVVNFRNHFSAYLDIKLDYMQR